MVKGNMFGIMGQYMKEVGKMIKRMVKESLHIMA